MAKDNRHTEQLFRRYLNGDAGPREEAELERLAQSDAFLAEAMDGVRSQPAQDHDLAVERLRKQLPRSNRNRVIAWPRLAAAASFLILLTAAVLWLPTQLNKDTGIAMQTETTEQAASPPTLADTEENEPESTSDESPAPPPENPAAPANMNTPEVAEQERERAKPSENLAARDVIREQADVSTAGSPPPPPPPPPAPLDPVEADISEEVAPEVVEITAYSAEEYAPPPTTTAQEVPRTFSAPEPTTRMASKKARQSPQADAFVDSGLREISGFITGLNDVPLPNAQVKLPGQLLGEPTDNNGFFRLLTDQTVSSFEVSHPDYQTAEVSLPKGENEAQISLDPLVEPTDDTEWLLNGATTTIYPNQEQSYAQPAGGLRQLRQSVINAKPDDLIGGKVRISFTVATDGQLSDFEFGGRSSSALQSFVRDFLLLNSRWSLIGSDEPARVVLTFRFR